MKLRGQVEKPVLTETTASSNESEGVRLKNLTSRKI
jgi:hypothetical protein